MSAQLRQSDAKSTPVLILTIANGYGHIRVANGIAAAIRTSKPSLPVMVVDVADYMTSFIRFTHVSTYLWLVKHAPSVWDRIDRYQKKQTRTSPEWYYRRGCHRLFDLARQVQPRALVATEVGCCEIAALIKRDLRLDVPLVAVNDDYDADRAWVQPEVDLYCFVNKEMDERLLRYGVRRSRIPSWGIPLSPGYEAPREHEKERAKVCAWLGLDPRAPIVLIAGGGEGMGKIEQTTARLLSLDQPALQLIVLTGRNERLKSRCERIAVNGSAARCRVLGWVGPEQIPELMWAADLMVSKLGSMFNEAVASELPIVAMKPPPGSERVQYQLLNEWEIGCAVRSLDEVVEQVGRLVSQPQVLEEMRRRAREHRTLGASQRIAGWLVQSLKR